MNHHGENYHGDNHSCHDEPGWFELTPGPPGVMPIGSRVGIDEADGRPLRSGGVPLVG
jgi:hypothetical protein